MMNTTNATETTDTLFTIYPKVMPLQKKDSHAIETSTKKLHDESSINATAASQCIQLGFIAHTIITQHTNTKNESTKASPNY